AVWKNDYEKVNGCNERFAGYCGEDYELACRLEESGIKMKMMVHLGIAYHFDHPRRNNVRWEDSSGNVQKLMQQIRSEEKGRCRTGLNRALEGVVSKQGVTVLD
ncbi:MAG: hypothetical protein LBH00_09540, partial [Planctomycetaceae bacterium]|nr:hypothetical protein [Planctomycetaceae bacterium]